MTKSLKLMLAGAALVLCMGASAQAATKDVILDSNGNAIRTQSGDCLRSNFDNSYDACKGEKPAPATVKETKSVFFAFGKSSLTKEAKKALDVLAADIKAKGPVLAVRVAGYADRIGKDAANEKLSKKRADAVRKYLLSKGIVNAQVVETRWFGDSVPEAKCSKKMPKKKLIKCLQPDRRVDVEIEMAAPEAK